MYMYINWLDCDDYDYDLYKGSKQIDFLKYGFEQYT